MFEKVVETVKFVKEKIITNPKVAIILGSGLNDLVDNGKLKINCEINYSDIPNFPVSTVQGHNGKLTFGAINGIDVVIMQGRFHFYEGYSLNQVTYPIYVMKQLGIKKLIVTNASGGINESFNTGDLMLITDHINFLGTNPLIGKNDERFGVRFPDISFAYNLKLQTIAKSSASKLNITLKEGVYLACTGPSYETAAEIRAFRVLGANAVGMSTVPEVIVANYLGLEVLGISCITNMATGIQKTCHSHDSVVAVAKKASSNMASLIVDILTNLNN